MKNSNAVLRTIAMALGNPVGYFGLPFLVCLLTLSFGAKQVTGTLPILVFLGVALISLVLAFLLMPIYMPFAGKRILKAIEEDYGPKTRQHVFDVFAAAQPGDKINLDITDVARAYREVRTSRKSAMASAQAPRTLEAVASQAAKELGAVLAIGDGLTSADLPIIRRRLDEVIQATNAAIQACEQQQIAQDADN